MLICAVWQVPQHADVCYNLPPGLWIFCKSKVKEETERERVASSLSDAACVHVYMAVYVAVAEEDVGDTR